MNSQAGLWLVTFATIHTLVRGLLHRIGRNLAPFLVNLLDVTLQTWLLRKSSLAKWTDQQRVLVLLLHVWFDGRLCCEHLKWFRKLFVIYAFENFSTITVITLPMWKFTSFISSQWTTLLLSVSLTTAKYQLQNLNGFYLVAKLTRETFANVIVEALDVCQEVVLLQEQLVADKTFESLAIVWRGKMQLELCRRAKHDVTFPATLIQLPVHVGAILKIVDVHVVGSSFLQVLLLLLVDQLLLLQLLLIEQVRWMMLRLKVHLKLLMSPFFIPQFSLLEHGSDGFYLAGKKTFLKANCLPRVSLLLLNEFWNSNLRMSNRIYDYSAVNFSGPAISLPFR